MNGKLHHTLFGVGANAVNQMNEDPKLYALAKRITLEAGFPYTDPRTMETTQPPTRKKTMANTRKKPKEVLFEQLHIDVYIKADMPEPERKDLRALLNSKPMMSLFESVIAGPYRDRIKVTVTK